jgi:phosphonate transport system ATP-binding protein
MADLSPFDIDLTVRANEHIAVMGRSGAGKSTPPGLLYSQRPADVALVSKASSLVRPLLVFHNVYMGQLDRHSTAYNLRNPLWPAACKVAEVRSVLERVGFDHEIFNSSSAHFDGTHAL